MLRRLAQLYRSRRLAVRNQARLRETLSNFSGGVPVFFIFTPELVHFAPFCVRNIAEGFSPIIVLNSVEDDDEAWLRRRMPEVPIVRLLVSLRNNTQSMLAHAEVLNDLFAVCDGTFCIQDPDCFVTDKTFWKHVQIEPHHCAGGPFTKRPSHGFEHVLPDTFFLTFDSKTFRAVADRYKITANVTYDLKPRAQARIKLLGYSRKQYPESFKHYYDTLQAYWLLALADGLEFKTMPGANQAVYHIGGTSYMHKTDYDLSHWDYWPLSVHYFNLRLLELPVLERFRRRFQIVIDQHQTADKLLRKFPEFAATKRFAQTDHILSTFSTTKTEPGR